MLQQSHRMRFRIVYQMDWSLYDRDLYMKDLMDLILERMTINNASKHSKT